MSVDLVVCHYKESLDWLYRSTLLPVSKLFIYEKGEKEDYFKSIYPHRSQEYFDKIINCELFVKDESTLRPEEERIYLPNFGREAHTIIHHIVTNYDNLADVTVFVQGNPQIHPVYLDKRYAAWPVTSCNLSRRYRIYLPTDPQYKMMLDKYEKWFDKKFNPNIPFFSSQGGESAFTKESLHNRPKSFYINVLKKFTELEGDSCAYDIEFIWPYFAWSDDQHINPPPIIGEYMQCGNGVHDPGCLCRLHSPHRDVSLDEWQEGEILYHRAKDAKGKWMKSRSLSREEFITEFCQ